MSVRKKGGARPDTWMPMYWGDYLRDTGHLSTAEHGAYLLLIGHYWTTGAPISDDDEHLRRIARMTSREWRVSRRTLEPLFTVSDGIWQHKRVDEELAKARDITDKRSKAGSTGVAKRWQNHSKRIATAPVSGWQNDTPSPSPSPSPVEPDRASPVSPRATGEVAQDDPGPIPSFMNRLVGVTRDWQPGEAVRMWARLQKFSEAQIAAEAEGFRAYSIGNGKSYANVDEAFKSWLIRSRQFGRNGAGSSSEPEAKKTAVYIP